MAASINLLAVLEKTARESFSEEGIHVKKIAVVRKSDRFSSGDIVIPSGCHDKIQNEVLQKLRDKIFKSLLESGQPVKKVSGDEFNSITVYLDRTIIFKEAIQSVMIQKERYGLKDEKRNETILLCNECLLNNKTLLNKDDISLDSLRSLMVQDHMVQLLQSQCYDVFQLVRKDTYENYRPVLSQYGTDSSSILEGAVNTDSKNSVISKFLMNKFIEKVEKTEGTGIEKGDSERVSETAKTDSGPRLAYEFNMREYLKDKNLNVGKTGFDKNLSVCEVFSLDSPAELLNTSVLVSDALKEQKAQKCIHVTGQSHAFSSQKIHLILRELLDIDEKSTTQKHFVYGPVTKRQSCSDSDIHTADDLFRLRYAQLRQAAIMKYGEAVHGEGWAATLEALTAACIKFEMLSCVSRNTLKLDLSEDEDMEGSGLATSSGSFVMYNCARLATLFKHFQEEVDSETYPPLPPISKIDFSVLREEAEWSLLFNYVCTFPDLVEQTIDNLDDCDTIYAKIHTHKVCQMLISLSRNLSSYYSRYHVLGEGRAQLLPTMYARLYLLKAVHQVMINGLALLGIQPLSQL
ncbi:DALR anticodon-binding domain-containing protein 3-like [Ruditapes philippinarum]|uniref:DALR anticodon-binding domain-containing protein 3-like n=1 Tax=Ruditapes philippinarum TaxID=129788 RepID=UPI00295BAFE5|nr:DALR anticodon-binding domain-containing protein 3-like [Ruditapes philippinarum]